MVELRPHVGNTIRRGEQVKTTLTRQFRVFLGGKHVGYCTNKPGANFRPTLPSHQFSPEEREAIDDAIRAQLGAESASKQINIPTSLEPESEDVASVIEGDVGANDLDAIGDDLDVDTEPQ